MNTKFNKVIDLTSDAYSYIRNYKRHIKNQEGFLQGFYTGLMTAGYIILIYSFLPRRKK